jgi:hypothetical protein
LSSTTPPSVTGPGLIETIHQEIVVIYYKRHLFVSINTVTLEKDLTVNGITVNGTPNNWRVTQDDLINTYSACWEAEGKSSCNYRP